MDLLELLNNLILLAGFVGMSSGFPEQLKATEEAECIRNMRRGDEEARERLITHNLRLVAHISKKYIRSGRDADDIISTGTIGLIKAVSTYNPEKGVPLSSYASRCIENEILMGIRQEKKQVPSVSINETIGVDNDGNDLSFLDILGSDPDLVPASVEDRMESERLLCLINEVLPEREKRVVLLRFGLAAGASMTQREVANILGISRSYVSRLESKALSKLREEFERRNKRFFSHAKDGAMNDNPTG